MAENETLYVLARSESQYFQWFRFGRRTGTHACYVESSDTIRGLTLPKERFVALPGWDRHPYANAIRQTLKEQGVVADEIEVQKGFRWE